MGRLGIVKHSKIRPRRWNALNSVHSEFEANLFARFCLIKMWKPQVGASWMFNWLFLVDGVIYPSLASSSGLEAWTANSSNAYQFSRVHGGSTSSLACIIVGQYDEVASKSATRRA